jgi:hypothetical protein
MRQWKMHYLVGWGTGYTLQSDPDICEWILTSHELAWDHSGRDTGIDRKFTGTRNRPDSMYKELQKGK